MNLKILTELDRILKNNPSLLDDYLTLTQVINGIFDIEISLTENKTIYELCDIVDDAVLARYFSEVWQAETKKFKYSGLAIIDEVNNLKPKSVIDIGCGYNEFKGKIENLIGIDPYNKRADIISTLLNYRTTDKYDIAICLGSINFGSSDKIISELKAAVDLVVPGGLLYFRVNPGIQHTKKEARWINFYDWDPVFISNISKMFNCELIMLRQDLHDRFYFVLRKNS